MTALEVKFLGQRGGEGGGFSGEGDSAGGGAPAPGGDPGITEDEIPF